MGETLIDIGELRTKLGSIGLEDVLFLSLQKQTVPSWRAKSKKIDEYRSIIDLEISIDPVIKWYLPIGKFYSDSRGYNEEPDYRAEELKRLFENDNILAYFTTKQPDFRLRNEDNLDISKSMIINIQEITSAGIQIVHLGMKPLKLDILSRAKEILHSVPYKPYLIGECSRGGDRDD